MNKLLIAVLFLALSFAAIPSSTSKVTNANALEASTILAAPAHRRRYRIIVV